mmetsp:Transcript_25208/g.42225  ORF Transcript_25208/g.42225 Transcript_25208/m.42225 type:complete len:266 (+) Transcript_25208:1000-1797(+)
MWRFGRGLPAPGGDIPSSADLPALDWIRRLRSHHLRRALQRRRHVSKVPRQVGPLGGAPWAAAAQFAAADCSAGGEFVEARWGDGVLHLQHEPSGRRGRGGGSSQALQWGSGVGEVLAPPGRIRGTPGYAGVGRGGRGSHEGVPLAQGVEETHGAAGDHQEIPREHVAAEGGQQDGSCTGAVRARVPAPAEHWRLLHCAHQESARLADWRGPVCYPDERGWQEKAREPPLWAGDSEPRELRRPPGRTPRLSRSPPPVTGRRPVRW